MIPTLLNPAAPCTDCGGTDGYAWGASRRPSRMSGKRFGIDGPLCGACYYKHRYRSVVRPRILAERAESR